MAEVGGSNDVLEWMRTEISFNLMMVLYGRINITQEKYQRMKLDECIHYFMAEKNRKYLFLRDVGFINRDKIHVFILI